MDLFSNLDDLKPYIFRIVDNGGATYDRFTIVFCDGDAVVASEGTLCAHIESVDVQAMADNVENGTERDLRWIDLPESLRKRLLADTNNGFCDWLAGFTPPALRADAVDNGTGDLRERLSEGVYGTPGAYYIRRETYPDDGTGSEDFGPMETIREAVLATVPEDYDLSGPEYFSEVDLWDESGGPADLWDSSIDPAHPIEVKAFADDWAVTQPSTIEIGEARDLDHARELADGWRAANPDLASLYHASAASKASRTFESI